MQKKTGRLRAVREARGDSLDDIVSRSGVDKAYLSKIERGLQRPSLPTLIAICRAIGLKDEARTLERLWP